MIVLKKIKMKFGLCNGVFMTETNVHVDNIKAIIKELKETVRTTKQDKLVKKLEKEIKKIENYGIIIDKSCDTCYFVDKEESETGKCFSCDSSYSNWRRKRKPKTMTDS